MRSEKSVKGFIRLRAKGVGNTKHLNRERLVNTAILRASFHRIKCSVRLLLHKRLAREARQPGRPGNYRRGF
jgi:hypothetical protein